MNDILLLLEQNTNDDVGNDDDNDDDDDDCFDNDFDNEKFGWRFDDDDDDKEEDEQQLKRHHEAEINKVNTSVDTTFRCRYGSRIEEDTESVDEDRFVDIKLKLLWDNIMDKNNNGIQVKIKGKRKEILVFCVCVCFFLS